MADVNQTSQELAEIMERVNRELSLYGELTRDTADQLNDAKVGIKGFSAATRMGGDALEHVGKAATAAAGAMYEGKKGAAAFNDSITELGTAAKIASAALALLIPGGPIIKLLVAGLGAAVSATAEYVKAANEMADKLYKGYSGMAKSGAAASDGMTGLYKDAKKLGLSMNQLDSYVSLVNENSKDLALFAGTAFEGRKRFADMGKEMESFREGMIAAGYDQEELNAATMQYLKLQTKVGMSQDKTAKDLAEGAKKYLVEQDALTKLTGMTRQEQEQAVEAARSQQRFRAKLEEMRQSGDKDQIARADELETQYKILYARSKEAAQGFGDMTTGMLGTDAAIKLQMSTAGEAYKSTQELVSGQKNAIQSTQAITEAFAKTNKSFNKLNQAVDTSDFLIKVDESAELGYMANKDLVKEYEKARAELKKQGADGGAAADDITAQYARNIKKQQELNKEMEDAVFKGIANAQSVTSGLASATGVLTKAFETLTDGINKLMNLVGLGQPERATTKSEIAADKEVDKAKNEYTEAMKNATVLQKMGLGLDQKMVAAKEKLREAEEKKYQTQMAAMHEYEKQKAAGNVTGGKVKNSAEYGTQAPPPATGGKAPPQPTTPVVTSQEQLSKAGLKVKQGDVQAKGAPIDQKIIDMAQQVQANLGGRFGYFSGFNDNFHQEKSPGSFHTSGMAMDFTLKDKPSKEEGQEIVKYLQSIGASLAIDEYNDPSSKATAGHIHAQINAYKDGGIAETPQIAFVGEKGPEAMIPLQNGAIPVKLGLDSPVMDLLMGKAVPGYGRLSSLASGAETAKSDQDLASKVLEIATLINPTVRVVSVLADTFKALTNLPKVDDIPAAETKSAASEIGQEFKSAVQDLKTNQTTQTTDPEMLNLLTELVREQRNANDNLQKIYQVSAN